MTDADKDRNDSTSDRRPILPVSEALDRAADLIRDADALMITSGAGMGVDSGLPDFRGPNGFWASYPALGRARIDFEAAASPQHFRGNPVQAWGFYGHRLQRYRDTVPSRAFDLLFEWGRAKPHGYFVNTSNVDGQFQKTGFSRDRICEIHGSMLSLQCMNACREDFWPADDFEPVVDEENCRLVNALPTCPRCGALARPNVLMFGDWEWVASQTTLQRLRRDQWIKEAQRLVVVEIGAGVHISTIRSFTQSLCRAHGAQAVRINPRNPEISPKHGIGLRMGGLEALEEIEKRMTAVEPQRPQAAQ